MGRRYLIAVPGLGDNRPWQSDFSRWALQRLSKHGLEVIWHPMKWHDGEEFLPKLKRLTERIDEIVKKGHRVALLGISAGGSAVLNAYWERKNKVERVVSVCGYLRGAERIGRFKRTAFYQSVKLWEGRVGRLSEEERQRVMTVRPRFGDEIVPVGATTVERARNVQILMGGHLLTIAAALTVYSRQIVDFLKSGDE